MTPQGVSLNMVTAVPCVGRSAKPESGLLHALGSKLDVGDLELRTIESQRLIATIPQNAYQLPAHQLTSGIVDVVLAAPWENLCDEIAQQGLCMIGTTTNGDRAILLQEQEIN